MVSRTLCAKCAALISDPDPTLIIDILRHGFEQPRPMDIEPEERWRFVQLLADDTSEARNHLVVLSGCELPMLAVSRLNGSELCAVHLGAYASLTSQGATQ